MISPYQTMLPFPARNGEFRHLKLYVGCALTNADPAYVKMVESFKDSLRPYVQVLDFLGLSGGREISPQVYHRDIHECIGIADLFIAFCDIPSIGLGYELATMIEKRSMPTVMFASVRTQLTRLAIGSAMSNRHVSLFEYEDFAQLFDVAHVALRMCDSKSSKEQKVIAPSYPVQLDMFGTKAFVRSSAPVAMAA